MGYRLSRITTRQGDGGETGLGDGARLSKAHARIEALGAVDELNSALGMLAAQVNAPWQDKVRQVQNDLFDLGGELAVPGMTLLPERALARLDGWVEEDNVVLAPLKEFILPGGTPAASLAHWVRTVCRRAERRLVLLAQTDSLGPALVPYLNRLSDWLFILARRLNHDVGCSDILWQRDAP